jgi:hypothetical protein
MAKNREDRKNLSRNLDAPGVHNLDRRSFLQAASAVAALGALGAPFVIRSADAKNLTKIKMILAWLPGGPYAYA